VNERSITATNTTADSATKKRNYLRMGIKKSDKKMYNTV
jgi:hypothetical protein